MNTFAERLALFRKRAGYRQEDFASEVGVSVDTVRRWEGEKQEPRLGELKLIAKVLGISINELAGDVTDTVTDTTQEKPIKPRQTKSSKTGMIVIKQGNTNIEFPATPSGYAILKEKLKEIPISQYASASVE